MTLEKNGYRIGDMIRIRNMSQTTLKIVGFMPESYLEQGLEVPSYYRDWPEEYLCCQNMTDNTGHNLAGLNEGIHNGFWVDPNNITKYLFRVPRLQWRDDDDIQDAFINLI